MCGGNYRKHPSVPVGVVAVQRTGHGCKLDWKRFARGGAVGDSGDGSEASGFRGKKLSEIG